MAKVTVKDLKRMVAMWPDTAVLVVPGPDHSYRPANINVTTARLEDGEINEDYETEDGERILICLVS